VDLIGIGVEVTRDELRLREVARPCLEVSYRVVPRLLIVCTAARLQMRGEHLNGCAVDVERRTQPDSGRGPAIRVREIRRTRVADGIDGEDPDTLIPAPTPASVPGSSGTVCAERAVPGPPRLTLQLVDVGAEQALPRFDDDDDLRLRADGEQRVH